MVPTCVDNYIPIMGVRALTLYSLKRRWLLWGDKLHVDAQESLTGRTPCWLIVTEQSVRNVLFVARC